MEFLYLITLPIIGSLWFLNFTIFLKRLNSNGNTRNQTILGVLLTFIFIFVFAYGYLATHY
ncbi:hypothetical protein F510_1393 [Anoxybacillus gonensis]|nr:hypothetical protein F510_1393 [Anoxybacillus gonensis]